MPEPEYSDDYTDPRLAIFYDQLNPWGSDRDFYVGHTGRLVGLDPAAAMLDQARIRTDVEWILVTSRPYASTRSSNWSS